MSHVLLDLCLGVPAPNIQLKRKPFASVNGAAPSNVPKDRQRYLDSRGPLRVINALVALFGVRPSDWTGQRNAQLKGNVPAAQ